MNPKTPRSRSNIIVSLMGSTGIMLLLCAIPAGLPFFLMFRYQSHFDIGVAALAGVSMTLSAGILGSVLLWLCIRLSKRRVKAAQSKELSSE